MLRPGWLVLLVEIALAQDPLLFVYGKGRSYGPDGPWQAIEVQCGGQNVSLYPGAVGPTRVNGIAMCGSSCLASAAGIYNRGSSPSVADPFTDLPSNYSGADLSGSSPASVMNLTGSTDLITDTLELTASSGQSYTIENSALVLINESHVRMPDETSYDTQVGFLGLGSRIQPWEYAGAATNLTPGGLQHAGLIPSNTFGLHIGSVLHGQRGSLVLGGYDRSRVIGTVGTWRVNRDNRPTAMLERVEFGVELGQNPFGGDPFDNFLNESFPSGVPMAFDSTIPYMYLPPRICEAIASGLPVTWLSGPGLYSWDTSSSKYSEIMNSAAYIAFTFNGSDVEDITIKVPFQLLNLTLEPPIVDQQTPYFPCKPSPELGYGEGRYFLGRAFLQAAYFAIRWGGNDGQWFSLAQAPGPDAGENNEIPLFEPYVIKPAEDMTFAQSWHRSWSAAATSLTGTEPPRDEEAVSDLSTGTIVGISTGTVAALATLVLAVYVTMLRHRRKGKESTKWRNLSFNGNMSEYNPYEIKQKTEELDSDIFHEVSAELDKKLSGNAKPVEIDSNPQIAELDIITMGIAEIG